MTRTLALLLVFHLAATSLFADMEANFLQAAAATLSARVRCNRELNAIKIQRANSSNPKSFDERIKEKEKQCAAYGASASGNANGALLLGVGLMAGVGVGALVAGMQNPSSSTTTVVPTTSYVPAAPGSAELDRQNAQATAKLNEILARSKGQ